MILCAVILWFCGYSVYNSEIFTMGRIWQGKAVLAGVFFLPFLFLLCMEIFLCRKKRNIHGAWLFLANGACCLFSSMGIMLAPLLMGVFALLSLVKFRDGRRFLKSVVCCLPSLILGVVYILVFLGGGEMKRALLASLDAWQKYWGKRILCLFTAGCIFVFPGIRKKKKERARILSGYIVVFSCCVFLSGDCLYYTEMYRMVGLLESIMGSSGSAAYSLCRNLPGKKGGSFQTTAVHTSDFYCGSAGFLRNWPE